MIDDAASSAPSAFHFDWATNVADISHPSNEADPRNGGTPLRSASFLYRARAFSVVTFTALARSQDAAEKKPKTIAIHVNKVGKLASIDFAFGARNT